MSIDESAATEKSEVPAAPDVTNLAGIAGIDEVFGDERSVSLWEGDEGGLEHAQRQALVALLKQRFISARSHPRDWQVLVAHERVLRSRLNDLFLELHIDRLREVAWKRQAVGEAGQRFPTLLHDLAWTREETIVLVHLRDRLRTGSADGEERVFVDVADLVEYAASFRPAHATDEAGDERRTRNAVASIAKAGLLLPTSYEERFEVSEAVEPLLPIEVLQELLAALRHAHAGEGEGVPADGGEDDPDGSAGEGEGLFGAEEAI
ncbi:DUF4194 domain-containing protein [Nocardioides sp. BP30]|uniref:DUF4194 domain-containing protein n=1 Tax=Nocardioides sp. BP30 TaxID=3036374 RepID=UPI0024697134|nr:DUF4194 domain-containing protein [Nocardioides sp. BP30]WGL50723.1 DUF4194 domain-containing protein [Nocardioides sp. BP30]